MKYSKLLNKYYYEGRPLTLFYNEEFFSGYPTEELLKTWGFEDIVEPEKTIEDYRKEKLAELKRYDSSSEVNSFSINGESLWLDAYTRMQLKQSIEAYQASGVENVTKWFNGIAYSFPIAQWLQMLTALEVYAAEALNTTEAHKAAISALETIQEIQDYDFTINYPNKISL